MHTELVSNATDTLTDDQKGEAFDKCLAEKQDRSKEEEAIFVTTKRAERLDFLVSVQTDYHRKIRGLEIQKECLTILNAKLRAELDRLKALENVNQAA